MTKHITTLILLLSLLLVGQLLAQDESAPADTSTINPPAPVTGLNVQDKPNDHGHALKVYWEPSADDNEMGAVMGYQVYQWRPNYVGRLDILRQKYNLVKAGRHAFAVSKGKAEAALAMVMDSVTDLAALPFVPALPAIDSTYVPTIEELSKALNDTIAVMDEEVSYTKDEIKDFRRMYLDSVEYLSTAYGEYPDNGSWVAVGAPQPPGAKQFEYLGSKEKVAGDFLPDNTGYYFKVRTLSTDADVWTDSEVYGPAECYGQWYNSGRTINLIFVLLFGASLLIFVNLARKGANLYVRPLAGIEAVDEAIGRATEMGKPILYVLGLGTAADVATIASFTILGRVAKKVAEYQTQLIVPTYDPIVMSVAQEVVKSSYMDAGRPDEYNEDIVFFVTQLQFAYVAAVNGIMLRELPATNVYMGKFYAESLLMAETGAVAGSIQIAGTDEIAQIPFFIVACDYTLIGEELYAASAYLGREPILLGSLKAQDWAKAAILILAIVGMLAAHFEWGHTFTHLFEVTN